VTLKTAGSDQLIVTDTSNSALTGSAPVAVSPGAIAKLAFGQQPPPNGSPGVALAPAVTVLVEDTYGNVETGLNSGTVTLTLGNANAATLSGATANVVSGVATFSGLSVSAAGTNYTLQASYPNGAQTLTTTSAAFSITASTPGGGTGTGSRLIEGFETSDSWNVVGSSPLNAWLAPWAAHDGANGLDLYGNNDWLYRADAGAQISAGGALSAWLAFPSGANGRAYLGFGASGLGTLSLVAAPNTGQLILQANKGYGYVDLAWVSQSYRAGQWYRLEVDWGTNGVIVGKLFASNGTTLLNQVRATGVTTPTAGGIALRATSTETYWDTITYTPGVVPTVAVAAP
jgi:hypothetical protein